MKFFVNLLILITWITLFSTSHAQVKIKFKKDVYESLFDETDIDKSRAFAMFSYWSKIDTTNLAVFYHLAKISHEWMVNTDPLREIADMKYYIKITGENYNKAINLCTGKNVRKYDKYIEDIEDNDYENILNHLNEQYKKYNTFKSNYLKIIEEFNHSVDHYNTALNIYTNINKNNYSLKDVLMKMNEDYNQNLRNLQAHFDSTLFYFNQYKKSINNFPIKGYNQEYSLKPINTFRLDGLTNANFLSNTIHFWDYNHWVENVFNKYDKEILQLRRKIHHYDSLYQNINKLISEDGIKNKKEFSIPPIAPTFINLVNKYDIKSLALDVLKYKKQKSILYWTMYDGHSKEISLKKTGEHYCRVLKEKLTLDSLWYNAINNISQVNYNNYKGYFDEKYEAFKKMPTIFRRDHQNDSIFLADAFNDYKNHILRYNFMIDDSSKYTVYKEDTIQLSYFQQIPGTLKNTAYIYLNTIKKIPGNDKYAIAFTKYSKAKAYLFFAITNSDFSIDKVEYVTNYDIVLQELFDKIKIYPGEQNSYMIYPSLEDNIITANNILVWDPGKNDKSTLEIEKKSLPVFFKTDDLNKKAYIGLNSKSDTLVTNNINQFIAYDIEGDSVLWEFNIGQNEPIDIVQTGKKYRCFFQSTTTNEIMINTIDDKGKFYEEKAISLGMDYTPLNLIKIDAENINFTALSKDKISLKPSKIGEAKFIYLLFDDKMKVQYSNISL